MVIVCPTCSSRFSVPDDALSDGKMVRCTVCKTTWQPEAEQPMYDLEPIENTREEEKIEEQNVEKHEIHEQLATKKVVVKTSTSNSVVLHFAFFFTIASSVLTYLFLSTTYISRIPSYIDYVTKTISKTAPKDQFKLSNISHQLIRRNDGLYVSVSGEIENISRSLMPTPYLSINLRTEGEAFANYASPETFINETWAEKIDATIIPPRSKVVFETAPRKIFMNDLVCTIKVGKNI